MGDTRGSNLIEQLHTYGKVLDAASTESTATLPSPATPIALGQDPGKRRAVKRGWVAALAAIVIVVATGAVVESIRENSADRGSPHVPQQVKSLPKPDLEVFMNVQASASQIRGVKKVLRESTQVRKFAFVSQADAYRKFKRLFKLQPDIIATTSPEALPASFPIELLHYADRMAVARALKRLPGVDEVKLQVRFEREIQRICRTSRASLPPNIAKKCR